MYQGCRHDTIMIIGAGSSITRHRREILECIKRYKCTTIGINNMTNFCYPNYHLWTNKQRYREFGECINSKKSSLMFSARMSKKLIRQHHKGSYISIKYSDNDKFKNNYSIKEECIEGRFRTAGCLAIAVAHLMEAKTIWISGMDGFTFYKRKKFFQHCYGSGRDDLTKNEGKERDDIVERILDKLSKIVNFKIVTPTKFDKHYDSSVLFKL